MNKKIMSFVLAMVLSVGLGVSNAFAYSYDKYANEFNASYEAGSGNENTTEVEVVSKDKVGDVLKGALTAVFSYFAGSLVSCQTTGGQFQLYDSYGARFSADNNGGIWNVNSVNLRTSDLGEIQKAGSAEAFLKKIGFSDQSIKVAAMDKNGNLLDKDGKAISASDGNPKMGSSKISDGWFDKLVDTLKSGVNFSASVSKGTGITGPSLTVSENGKPMAVYQTNPQKGSAEMTTLYRYDDNGFMCGIETKTFETKETSNGTMQLNSTINYTKISYDSNGVRTDETYKFKDFSNDPEGTIANAPLATPDKKEFTGNEKAMLMSKTTYSANNSTLSTIDYTTNCTSYFANNKQSYVVNDVGSIVEMYRYSENGSILAHFNANGTDTNGKKVGTTTIYDKWGRDLYTAVEGENKDIYYNNSGKADKLTNDYYTGIQTGKFDTANFKMEGDKCVAEAGSGTPIMSVNIYADQILNTNNEKIMTNGFIDMNKVNTFISKGDTSIVSKGLYSFGYTDNDVVNMLNFATGNVAMAKTSIAHSSWPNGTFPEGATVDKSGLSEEEFTETVGSVTKSMGTHRQWTVAGTESAGEDRVIYNGIQYNNTILLGGAQAYSKTHCVVSEQITIKRVNAIIESDPAVEGELWAPQTEEELVAKAEELGIDTSDEEAMNDLRNGFYTDSETGKTYAIVDASSINIMDGSGFQPAKGEVVLVEVSEKVKNAISSGVEKSGDRSIMFMGDVRPSANGGYLTMAMNTSYGGGLVQGKEAVQQAKDEIALVSMGTAIANGADIKALQGKLDDYNKANGTNYTLADATTAYEKAKEENADNWIITNTNANMNLFNNQFNDYNAGWALLVKQYMPKEGETPALF